MLYIFGGAIHVKESLSAKRFACTKIAIIFKINKNL